MFFDSQRSPDTNDVADTYYWKSTSSTGSSTTIFDDLTIPSSPNFPNSTATRYIMNLPGEPYYAGIDAGNSTFIVKNVNTTTFLTRVAYNGTLSANTYKIFPSNSATPARLEVHVGVGSNSAGDVLAYHGRFVTSIANAKDFTECQIIDTEVSPQKILILDSNKWSNYAFINGTVIVQGTTNTTYYFRGELFRCFKHGYGTTAASGQDRFYTNDGGTGFALAFWQTTSNNIYITSTGTAGLFYDGLVGCKLNYN